MTTGETLKRAREEKGLTQKALASLAGCGDTTISYYERGSKKILEAHARKIEAVLGLPDGALTTNFEYEFIYDMIEYHYGLAVNHFQTNSREEARDFYLRSGGETAVRIWYKGEKLSYIDSDRLMNFKYGINDH